MKCHLFFVVMMFLAGHAQAADDEKHNAPTNREVIQRSVPFIERQGAEWIAKKDCLSCHHTAFMVWSLNAANQKGIHVDQKKREECITWATDWHHLVVESSRAAANRETTILGQCDTAAQLLLGRARVDTASNQPQWAVEYTNDLLKAQQPDGSWTSGGQLPSQKRPKRETQEVTTMWVLLALTNSHPPGDTLPARQEKAHAWLGVQTAGESTEWWATRAILERTLGNAAKADQVRAELLKRQRADGGWGWLSKDDSDALATGIALFALRDDKSTATTTAIVSARRFLARTQRDDGSWPVHGTKQNHKDSIEPTSTFWGTCWAVIGLCATLDN